MNKWPYIIGSVLIGISLGFPLLYAGQSIPGPAIPPVSPPVYIEPQYQVTYPLHFFDTGGKKVEYNQSLHLKMGIVIHNRTDMTIATIIQSIFESAPFDRYRDFFVFADADAAGREIRLNNQYITTYDSYAHRLSGGFDWTAMKVRAGLVVLDINDYEWRRSGALGYSYKETAVTQRSTILHELGHVLGDLGDEYSVSEVEELKEIEKIMAALGKEYAYRMGREWQRVRANLDYRTRNPLKWFPLVDQGFIPEKTAVRVEIKDNHDIGLFAIPTSKCVMNHPEKSEGRFCPVCQLQIIQRIAQFTGCKTPWDKYE